MKQEVALPNISDANFPKDNEGRSYHVGVKAGEVANNIITGSPCITISRRSCSCLGNCKIYKGAKFISIEAWISYNHWYIQGRTGFNYIDWYGTFHDGFVINNNHRYDDSGS
jgi:hypothetical protein